MNITLTIPTEALPAVSAIAARANQSTEDYVAARVADLFEDWRKSEIQRLKDENRAFFDKAAELPEAAQERVRQFVLAEATAAGLVP